MPVQETTREEAVMIPDRIALKEEVVDGGSGDSSNSYFGV
jgi:hypothetical protein